MNCHAEHSKQASTGQRTIDLNTIPAGGLKIDRAHIQDECLLIKWNFESKQPDTIIPVEFLISYNPSKETCSSPKYETCRDLKFFDFTKLVVDAKPNKSEIFRWLMCLAKYGVCVVQNVPTSERMVKTLAELIAPVQHTIYGDVFDVRVDENPINIAYSNAPLEFHMDLMYYESPPGLQFLHCLRFDDCIRGGESIFLDSFKVAEQFGRLHPVEFSTLTRIPATFQKLHVSRSRPVLMVYRRPHICLSQRSGRVIAVNWSPPFEGPLANVSLSDAEAYYVAYFKFVRFLNAHEAKLEYRLRPGEVACFNNRRVLHGRNGFELNSNGVRHFQGCYVNIDEFKSEVLVNEFAADSNIIDRTLSGFIDISNLDAFKFMYGNHDYS